MALSTITPITRTSRLYLIRVLESVRKLLEASNGPVLEKFLEDAQETEGQAGQLACSVNFQRTGESTSEVDQMLSAFMREVAQMKN